jgi:DNA-directed RNA polymerase specialized sigma24 family protein
MPVNKEYPLDRFIGSIVSRVMRTYKMEEHVREDLQQEGWLAVLTVQQKHPKAAKNRKYLERCVVNKILQIEQKDRPRRNNQSDMKDTGATPDKTQLLVKDLIEKANLSPAEREILGLHYGLDEADWQPCHVKTIAVLMERPIDWVQARLDSAKLKLGIVAGAR